MIKIILREATIKYAGYDPDDLKSGSGKRICRSCDKCGRVKWVSKCNYQDLCQSCTQQKRWENPEEKEKQRVRLKSYYEDPIEREKLKQRSVKYWEDPKSREKASIKTKKDFEDPKRREKQIISLEEYFVDPKSREKQIIGAEKYWSDIENRIEMSCIKQGVTRKEWKGFTTQQKYCYLFNLPLKVVIRLYFNNNCFMDNEPEQNGRSLSVHHVNYDKRCGCDATQFCIFIPVKAKWNGIFNGNKEHNRWYWYSFLMNKIFIEHPNYFTYHIPVWGMNELEYNYDYVFEKFRRR